MVLSDVVFLLYRAGIESDKKPLRRLLVVRDWSTPLGLAAVVLTMIGQNLIVSVQIFV
jgi:hypothetical protein